MSEKKLKSAYDYQLKEVILSIDRLGDATSDIDITNIVAQLDIHESINRPFLISNIVISDTSGLISSVNFIGTERVNVKLHLIPSADEDPVIINKNFIITEIKNTVKIGDESDVISLEMIEDSGYRNYLENINRPYTGSGSQIIANCISEFLDKKLNVVSDEQSNTKPFKIIVPNWHPFDVVKWVKSLMVREFGFPYYFYSTIHSNDIIQDDLLSILERGTVNPSNAFSYSTSAANNVDDSIVKQAYTINDIKFNSTLNTLNKIREGNVGSSNQQIDLVKNSSSREILHFDVYKMFKDIKTSGGIPATQTYIPYDNQSVINDKKLHDYDSRRISELQVSYIYDKNTPNSTDVIQINQQLMAKSIKSWMQENKITLQVPGRNFLESSTQIPIKLADTIMVNILDSKNNKPGKNTEAVMPEYNKKQSGEYIIQSLRHMFVLDRYSTIVECVKLTDIENSGEKLV